MSPYFQVAHLNGFRVNILGLPGWARTVLAIFAVPGIVLLALSIAAVLCSLLALFLLTVPVYRLLRVLTGGSSPMTVEQTAVDETPGRRHVDVKIIE
jgi:hypothetical protein